MEKFDRLNVDLAALQTLRVVYEMNSFSMAARYLDMNQSTISYTINRLREAFGDPLFVRTGRGIQATERCSEIVEGAGGILERFEKLTRPKSFDPSTAEFSVVIALNHHERAVLLPRIIRYLRKNAPGIRVEVMHAQIAGHTHLREGVCDILISPIKRDADMLYRRHLYRDRYVCVVDRKSKFVRTGMTIKDYAASKHIRVSYEGLFRPPYLAALGPLGLSHMDMIDLSSSDGIEQLVSGTDLIATVSSKLAESYSDEVAIIEAPFDVNLDIDMYWTAKTQSASNMRWIREVVVRTSRLN